MILQRLKQFIDVKGLTIASFEKSIGMSNASFGKSLKNNGAIGSDKLENILSVYSEINPIWLLTGQGEMLTGVPTSVSAPQEADNSFLYNMYKEEKAENKELIEQVGALKQTIRQLEEKIAGLQQNIRPDMEFGTDKASVGSTRTRKSGVVGLGDAQFVER